MAGSQVPDRRQARPDAGSAQGRRAQGLSRHATPLLAAALLAWGVLHPPASGAQPGARPPIGELTAALQAKYDTVADFSADFEQRYAGGVLRTTVVERGAVHIKKPGMMRWRYTWPEEKLFVSDGAALYSYIPADGQVIVGEVPAGDNVSTPALFLAGRGRLADDFIIAYDDADPPPDHWALRLTPVRDDADYVRLQLVVDRSSLSFRQLRAIDFQGAVSTFTFTNLRENTAPADALFRFEVPAGVEVITADGAPR